MKANVCSQSAKSCIQNSLKNRLMPCDRSREAASDEQKVIWSEGRGQYHVLVTVLDRSHHMQLFRRLSEATGSTVAEVIHVGVKCQQTNAASVGRGQDDAVGAEADLFDKSSPLGRKCFVIHYCITRIVQAALCKTYLIRLLNEVC